MIYYKKNTRQYPEKTSVIVAMCDENLVGKKLVDKKTVLDLSTYAGFYKGELISAKQATEIIKQLRGEENTSFNLVGKETLAAASQVFSITAARKIKSVPHLQIYSL